MLLEHVVGAGPPARRPATERRAAERRAAAGMSTSPRHPQAVPLAHLAEEEAELTGAQQAMDVDVAGSGPPVITTSSGRYGGGATGAGATGGSGPGRRFRARPTAASDGEEEMAGG